MRAVATEHKAHLPEQSYRSKGALHCKLKETGPNLQDIRGNYCNTLDRFELIKLVVQLIQTAGNRAKLHVQVRHMHGVILFVCSLWRNNYRTERHQTLRDYKVGLQKCPPPVKIARLAVLEEVSFNFRFFVRG